MNSNVTQQKRRLTLYAEDMDAWSIHTPNPVTAMTLLSFELFSQTEYSKVHIQDSQTNGHEMLAVRQEFMSSLQTSTQSIISTTTANVKIQTGTSFNAPSVLGPDSFSNLMILAFAGCALILSAVAYMIYADHTPWIRVTDHRIESRGLLNQPTLAESSVERLSIESVPRQLATTQEVHLGEHIEELSPAGSFKELVIERPISTHKSMYSIKSSEKVHSVFDHTSDRISAGNIMSIQSHYSHPTISSVSSPNATSISLPPRTHHDPIMERQRLLGESDFELDELRRQLSRQSREYRARLEELNEILRRHRKYQPLPGHWSPSIDEREDFRHSRPRELPLSRYSSGSRDFHYRYEGPSPRPLYARREDIVYPPYRCQCSECRRRSLSSFSANSSIELE
ncbi:uncharacterized protein V1516DRAFT_663380 [Lipomyces oligophaga]|uniref:uncharacterized protein n=1 Tax=Lipomyces oligophaga TaxID=45792 RepID=UPI0034CDC1B6